MGLTVGFTVMMIQKTLFTQGELLRLIPGCYVKVNYNTLYSSGLLFKMFLMVYILLTHMHLGSFLGK